MSGKKPAVNPLALQKELLIAESEVNRMRLLQEWRVMADGAAHLAEQAVSIKTVALSIMPLVAGLAAFTRGKSATANAKSSWFTKIVSGARLASTIWLLLRARGSGRAKK